MSASVHPSSWSNRALRDHAAATDRRPWQTGSAPLAAAIDAAVSAVREAMPHLSAEAIMVPPHAWFDAALARQMVVFVLAAEFDIPRRAVAAVSLMSREAICRGLRTIEARALEAEEFRTALEKIRVRANEFYRAGRLS